MDGTLSGVLAVPLYARLGGPLLVAWTQPPINTHTCHPSNPNVATKPAKGIIRGYTRTPSGSGSRALIRTSATCSAAIKGDQRGQAHIILGIQPHNPNSSCPASCNKDSSCCTRGLPRGLASRLCPVVASIFA